MNKVEIKTQCCIAGGGPAGVMLGYLLARAGIEVTVLEKWPDFFRDFRGDTIHPSTMEVLHELGLLEEFLKLPHQEIDKLEGQVGDAKISIADFSHLPVRKKFVGFIPQWDFLNFLSGKARAYQNFHLLMETEATRLVRQNGKVVGITAKNHKGEFSIHADLVVDAEGRHSVLREQAGLTVENFGAPMDVLWFRISRRPTDPASVLGRFDRGKIMIMLDRDDYWQCGFVIPKGGLDELKRQGLKHFRTEMVSLGSFLKGREQEIASWDQLKLLTVGVDRLRRWYQDSFVCIGDAAHTMSPIGGVGINLAIQDAVAAANILIPAFRQGSIDEKILDQIQKRREFPTKVTQKLQVFLQNHFIAKTLSQNGGKIKPPLLFTLFKYVPLMRRLPARLIGMGIRPEHIQVRFER